MSDDEPEHAQHLAFLRAFLGPELTDAGEEIKRAANFRLSKDEHKPWKRFVEWINTQPTFIKTWRAETGQPRYLRFMGAIADSQQAYTAALYHISRIEELEGTIKGILARHDFSNLPGGTTVALGQTNITDFEYHSFVFAYRRCLDYLTWGLGTYFGVGISSYRQFGEKVGRWSPIHVANVLDQSYRRHAHHFGFVMDKERGKSLRDKLAHRSFVQAFVVNITRSNFRLMGGGEGLGIGDRADDHSLGQVLRERLSHLHRGVADMLDSFRSAVSMLEAAA